MEGFSPAPPLNPPKRRRVFGRPLAAVVALCLVALALVVTGRKQLAEYMIVAALQRHGLTDVSVVVTSLGRGGATIENLTANKGALHIDRINMGFDIALLLQGRIRRFEAIGGTIVAGWDQNGLHVGGVRAAWNGSPSPGGLPVTEYFALKGLSVSLETPGHRLGGQIDIDAAAQGGIWNVAADAGLKGEDANLEMRWRGTANPHGFEGWNGQGRLSARTNGLTLPRIAERIDAVAVITLNAGNGAFTLGFEQPLEIRAGSLDADLRSALSLSESTTPSPVFLRFGANGAAPPFVVRTAGLQQDARVDLQATASAGPARASMVLTGEMLDIAGAAPRLNVELAALDGANLPVKGSSVSGRVSVAKLAGTLDRLRGQGEATADIRTVKAGAAHIERLQMAVRSRIEVGPSEGVATLETFHAIASGVTVGAVSFASPANLVLVPAAPANQRHLTLGFGANRSLTGSADLLVSIPEMPFDAAKATLQDIAFGAESMRVTGTLAAHGVETLSIVLQNGAMRHRSADFTQAGARIDLADDRISATASAQVARLFGPTSETPSKPLSVSAHIRGDSGGVAATGTIAVAGGGQLGEFSGRVTDGGDRGNLALSIPKTRFARNAAFDQDALSAIGGVSDFTGVAGLTVSTAWAPGRTTQSATLRLEGTNFALGEVSVTDLDIDAELSGFFPPRTKRPATITAKSIDAGLPFTGLHAEILLPGGNTANVSSAGLQVAGGEVRGTDLVIPLDDRPGRFALDVDNIDMAHLAALAKVEGLSINGRLSGTIPIRSDGGILHFDNGVLQAGAPGRLAYKPATPPAALSHSGSGDLLLQALSNFEYQRLSLTANGPISDEITVAVALAGRNPDLYGGYPVEFNLNLSGKLTQILTEGLVRYHLPANLEQQLRTTEPAAAAPQ